MICQADALRIPLADESVDCCMTSPPYWGLRDYGLNGSGIGLERTPEEYVAHIVEAFREVWRVLKPQGTLWLNLGTCHYGDSPVRKRGVEAFSETWDLAQTRSRGGLRRSAARMGQFKPKDLVGLAWMVAFALQADGWYLRSDIIWSKPNPMPESVTDRPTKAHEYLFLLAKQARYYYDAEAVTEESTFHPSDWNKNGSQKRASAVQGEFAGKNIQAGKQPFRAIHSRRNRRSVWTIPSSSYKGAHFATFPPALVEPCILAGTSAKGNCPVCGKAWERVTENHREPRPWTTKYFSDRADGGNPTSLRNNRASVGWRPTCDHYPRANEWREYIEPRRNQELTAAQVEENAAIGRLRTELLVSWSSLATSRAIVLDPFCGSGTVGQVCRAHGRRFVGLDLSIKYLRKQAIRRAEGRYCRLSAGHLHGTRRRIL